MPAETIRGFAVRCAECRLHRREFRKRPRSALNRPGSRWLSAAKGVGVGTTRERPALVVLLRQALDLGAEGGVGQGGHGHARGGGSGWAGRGNGRPWWCCCARRSTSARRACSASAVMVIRSGGSERYAVASLTASRAAGGSWKGERTLSGRSPGGAP